MFNYSFNNFNDCVKYASSIHKSCSSETDFYIYYDYGESEYLNEVNEYRIKEDVIIIVGNHLNINEWYIVLPENVDKRSVEDTLIYDIFEDINCYTIKDNIKIDIFEDSYIGNIYKTNVDINILLDILNFMFGKYFQFKLRK